MGTGHFARCLTLAGALKARGATIVFICRQLHDSLRQRVRQDGHDLVVLDGVARNATAEDLAHSSWLSVDQEQDASETLLALSGGTFDWVVVDHYALDARWERTVRRVTRRLMAIDDLADRLHDCDLLLDQNLLADMDTRYAGKVPHDCTLLLGPRYALLQTVYAELHAQVRVRNTPVQRILVYFGGVDSDNLTGRTMAALIELGLPDTEVDAVLPLNAVHAKAMSTLTAGMPHVRLHHGLPSLAPLMARADLAIGACGATTWERICLALPTLAVSIADNQVAVATKLHEMGLIHWIGSGTEADERAIGKAVEFAIGHGSFSAWSRRCMQVCDGRGTVRTVESMMARQGSEPSVDSVMQVQ